MLISDPGTAVDHQLSQFETGEREMVGGRGEEGRRENVRTREEGRGKRGEGKERGVERKRGERK